MAEPKAKRAHTVSAAATVVCLSRHNAEWCVLMGQNEVRNWFKASSESDLYTMRYPGEWKFPGGRVDPEDASVQHCAHRELCEEFPGLGVPEFDSPDFCIHLLAAPSQTIPIQGKSFTVHTFFALAEENPWLLAAAPSTETLSSDAVASVNQTLETRKLKFEELRANGKYFELSSSEREIVCPEVHLVEWLPLEKALSDLHDAPVQIDQHAINSWQKEEFERWGVQERDPMFLTRKKLELVHGFETSQKLLAHASKVSPP